MRGSPRGGQRVGRAWRGAASDGVMEVESGAASCSGCGRLGHRLSLCRGCGTAVYCGRQCQKSHWALHKASCRAASAAIDQTLDQVRS
jgi:hypothetical protein